MCFQGQYCGKDLANMMLYATNGCSRFGGVTGTCVTFEGQDTNNENCEIYEECCGEVCNPYEISADEC